MALPPLLPLLVTVCLLFVPRMQPAPSCLEGAIASPTGERFLSPNLSGPTPSHASGLGRHGTSQALPVCPLSSTLNLAFKDWSTMLAALRSSMPISSVCVLDETASVPKVQMRPGFRSTVTSALRSQQVPMNSIDFMMDSLVSKGTGPRKMDWPRGRGRLMGDGGRGAFFRVQDIGSAEVSDEKLPDK